MSVEPTVSSSEVPADSPIGRLPIPEKAEEVDSIAQEIEAQILKAVKAIDKQALTDITGSLTNLFKSLNIEIKNQPKSGKGSVALEIYYKDLGGILSKVSGLKALVMVAQTSPSETLGIINSKIKLIWEGLIEMKGKINGDGKNQIGKLNGKEQTEKAELLDGFLGEIRECKNALEDAGYQN